jgi:hypothetical protein
MTLTPRQLLALRFIAERCAAGLPPTRAEINRHVGANSRCSHLPMALARRGLIETEIATKRGIRMTPEGWRVAGVQSRLELLEELYRAADMYERGEYAWAPAAFTRALQAVRDLDAAATAAAERAA